MTTTSELGQGSAVYHLWRRLGPVPGRSLLFGLFIRRIVPYTGTVRPRVIELRPGYARIRMRDRRGVRNHLNSIHALAIANLAEFTTGLAFVAGLPPDARAILTGLSIEFLKKGRGVLTAECTAEVADASERRPYACAVVVRDAAGDVVARATTHWLVGPRDRR